MLPQGTNRAWWRAMIFLLVLGGITAALIESGVFHFFLDRARMSRFLDSLGMWGFAGFILLQVVQVVAAPIPGEATGILGGFLYGPALGILLSTVGLTIGSFIAFALSRAFGRPLTEKLVDKSTMDRFDYLLHHKGKFLVFLLFLIPGFPKDYLCYILGLGHLSTLEFLGIASSGRLLGTSMLTLGGHYLRDKEYWNLFLLCGAAVVVIFFVIAYRDKLERVFKRIHERHRRK